MARQNRKYLACALALICSLALPSGIVGSAAAEEPAAVGSKATGGEGKPALAAINKGPLGYWKHIDEDSGKTQSIFKVWMHKGKLVGKIVRVFQVKPDEKPNKVCSECEGRRHNRPIEGMTFFWGFTPDKDEKGKWVDGKILNPDDGEVYNAEAELSADGKHLEVFGYIRVLIKIGGTSVWQRPTAKELEGII